MEGRVAIITGASRGIGERIAKRFAAERAAVALVARTAEPGKSRLPGSLDEVVDLRLSTAGPGDLTGFITYNMEFLGRPVQEGPWSLAETY
jgi:NAD(P)-dependent dehydrogenase (short-subunit alcohol dehydrogenase family)